MGTPIEALALSLMNPLIVGETDLIERLNNMTPEEYFDLGTTEKLFLHINVANLSYYSDSFSEAEFFKRVSFNKTFYTYKYTNNGSCKYFKNAKEVSNHFGRTINKVWIDIKSGVLEGALERIKETHVSRKDGVTFKILKGSL